MWLYSAPPRVSRPLETPSAIPVGVPPRCAENHHKSAVRAVRSLAMLRPQGSPGRADRPETAHLVLSGPDSVDLPGQHGRSPSPGSLRDHALGGADTLRSGAPNALYQQAIGAPVARHAVRVVPPAPFACPPGAGWRIVVPCDPICTQLVRFRRSEGFWDESVTNRFKADSAGAASGLALRRVQPTCPHCARTRALRRHSTEPTRSTRSYGAARHQPTFGAWCSGYVTRAT